MIFLYGPPGSGKTTLGKILASRLGMPFYDLDEKIEAAAGTTIASIFAAQGEPVFRQLESSHLKGLEAQPSGVVALGGGTLLSSENRILAETLGEIVCLSAPAEILLERCARAGPERPLLGDDLANRLVSLLAARASHYASFPRRLDTSALPPNQIASRLELLLGKFFVCGMGDGYPVSLKAGSLDSIGDALAHYQLAGPVGIVADDRVASLYASRVEQSLIAAGFTVSTLTFPAGEHSKTIHTAIDLWSRFTAAGLERNSTVLALGGGVTGDLAGFAASAFKRGVRWVYMPTSLLAMADASLGGKTAVDLPEGKNLVGSFHPPALVWADPDTLTTLPPSELRSGMAEIVKAGVIADPHLFAACSGGWVAIRQRWPDIIGQAMQVKIRVIESDPFEKGPREVLNLGHTIGHAVEHASAYRLRHGEAVAIGMVAEAELAERLGIASPGLASEIAACLNAFELPTAIPRGMNYSDLRMIMAQDKKRRGGVVRFALPRAIGDIMHGVEVEACQIFSS